MMTVKIDSEMTPRETKEFSFQEILPHLATFYRNGVLVPFIGAGMSAPICCGWLSFLVNLATSAGVEIPASVKDAQASDKPVDSAVLYRLADATVTRLRPLSSDQRENSYRMALGGKSDDPNRQWPAQTWALKELFWPLVLTTNYDDLYWSAAAKASPPPSVVGRHRADCHRVLRSLDSISEPLLWALQGFLGGQYAKPEEAISDSAQRLRLAEQVVAGHQQYQRAVNADAHFRRAFGEIFRRRSLLFLGSGLLEDYFVNLFGEILHHNGPGKYPHFALLPADQKARFDPAFLQIRMGVVPVFYKCHSDLPIYLKQLAALVRNWPFAPRFGVQDKQYCLSPTVLALQSDELGFTLCHTKENAHKVRVTLRYAKLPTPNVKKGECSLVSLGRGEDNMPLEGNIATLTGLLPGKWRRLDKKPSYAYKNGAPGIYGVAARRKDLPGGYHDQRDLGIIPEAVCATLQAISKANTKYRTVHISPIASGRQRTWHPVHPFAQTLVGVRQFLKKAHGSSISQINLYIVDPQVWSLVMAGKVPVAELLSSQVTTNWVELRDADGDSESFSVTSCEPPTLGELLQRCNIDRKQWKISLLPPPMGEKAQGEELLYEMDLAPTMKIVLTPSSVSGQRS